MSHFGICESETKMNVCANRVLLTSVSEEQFSKSRVPGEYFLRRGSEGQFSKYSDYTTPKLVFPGTLTLKSKELKE